MTDLELYFRNEFSSDQVYFDRARTKWITQKSSLGGMQRHLSNNDLKTNNKIGKNNNAKSLVNENKK